MKGFVIFVLQIPSLLLLLLRTSSFFRHTSSVFEPKILFMIPNLPEKLGRQSRLKSGLLADHLLRFYANLLKFSNRTRETEHNGVKLFLKSHLILFFKNQTRLKSILFYQTAQCRLRLSWCNGLKL